MINKIISWAVERFCPQSVFFGSGFPGKIPDYIQPREKAIAFALIYYAHENLDGVGSTLTVASHDCTVKGEPVGSFDVVVIRTAMPKTIESEGE